MKSSLSITNDIMAEMLKLTEQTVRADRSGKKIPAAMVKTARGITRMIEELGPAVEFERQRLFPEKK